MEVRRAGRKKKWKEEHRQLTMKCPIYPTFKGMFLACRLHCSALGFDDCTWCIFIPAGLRHKPSEKANSLKSERGEQ